MKIEIKDKNIRINFSKELKELCHKYNAYPMTELNLKDGIMEHKLYELNKLTTKEKLGIEWRKNN